MNSENKDTISLNITISEEMEVAIAELLREIGCHLKSTNSPADQQRYQLIFEVSSIPQQQICLKLMLDQR